MDSLITSFVEIIFIDGRCVSFYMRALMRRKEMVTLTMTSQWFTAIIIYVISVYLFSLGHAATKPCPFEITLGSLVITPETEISDLNISTFTSLFNCIDFFGKTLRIQISENAISSVSIDALSYFYELKHLDLSHNEIKSLHRDTFKSLQKLEYLDLSFNLLTNVSAGLIDNYVLREANFEHNLISYVEPGFLSDFHNNLEMISLRNNSIPTFEPWPYLVPPGRPRIMVDLQYNKMASFTNHMNWSYVITAQGTRATVNIQHNLFQSMSIEEVHQYFPYLTGPPDISLIISLGFDARNNPYNCDCTLYTTALSLRQSVVRWKDVENYRYRCSTPSKVKDIDWLHDLSYKEFSCNLTVTEGCPTGCFCQDRPHNDTFFVDCKDAGLTEMPTVLPYHIRTRIEMNLDFNRISELNNVSYLSRIYNLSLNSNKLLALNSAILKDLSALKFLDIRHNQLSYIPVELQKFSYGTVQLAGNPLECNCDYDWVASWVEIDENGDKSVSCREKDRWFKLMHLSVDNLDCSDNSMFTLGLTLGGLVVLCAILFGFAKRCPYETKVIFHKLFRIHPQDRYNVDRDNNKQTDIYLSFDNEDSDVIGWLSSYFLKKLNKRKPFYTVLNPSRFMEPGSEAENIERWVSKSRRIIVILSENFFNNDSRMHEIKIAEDNLIQAQSSRNFSRTRPSKVNQVDVQLELKPRQSNEEMQSAAHIIYIVFNKSAKVKEMLESDIWRSRLAEKTVLSPDDRLFWSKLRYELPLRGQGTKETEDVHFKRSNVSGTVRRRQRNGQRDRQRSADLKALSKAFEGKNLHFTQIKRDREGVISQIQNFDSIA